jgi:hypothetical protein
MLFSYCKSCLPGSKVVLGYSEKIADLRTPHNAHPQTEKNGWAAISFKEWETVFVEGDDTQTKANIIASFGNRME